MIEPTSDCRTGQRLLKSFKEIIANVRRSINGRSAKSSLEPVGLIVAEFQDISAEDLKPTSVCSQSKVYAVDPLSANNILKELKPEINLFNPIIHDLYILPLSRLVVRRQKPLGQKQQTTYRSQHTELYIPS